MSKSYSSGHSKKRLLRISEDPSEDGYTVQGSGFEGNILTTQKLDLPLRNDAVNYGFASLLDPGVILREAILTGDCKDVLKTFGSDTFDLIVTSPPYADARKNIYGGIHPDQYVKWFIPRSAEFLRTLKPGGTFILNIKEKVVDGERHTYVIDLIKGLKKQGWQWTEEFIWHKRNCYPGKWPNRFRDSWERCLQFNKSRKFNMYQNEVMVPVGRWAQTRLRSLSETDKVRDNSRVGSGFGKNISKWVGRGKVYPTNVLQFATECGNVNHSAAFPITLPEWFIKLFTRQGDLVLDPFAGSGTTGVAAKSLKRGFVLIDTKKEYSVLARKRIENIRKRT
ncbi:MAG: site-specific DNA-methyltransferase [Candidatus Altiarchaeota archaeon]|nr:site-specific DNA-methyltransferase [Candidatus Altiarchaeota archaeon]